MKSRRGRKTMRLAGDVAVVLLMGLAMGAAGVGFPTAEPPLLVGQAAEYRMFPAEQIDDMLVPTDSASTLKISAHAILGRPDDLALRFHGTAAGPGEETVFLHGNRSVAWSSVVHAEHGRDELFLEHPITPHCLVNAVLLIERACGTGTTSAHRWMVQGAWTSGAPHGVADEIVEHRDELPWPLLLAVRDGEKWLVFERLGINQFRSVPLEWPALAPNLDVDMRPATQWLFDDGDPAPRLGVPLGDAFKQAEGDEAWRSFWTDHPDATVVGVEAPRSNILDRDPVLTWTLLVEDGDDSWELHISDESTLRNPPGILRPAADSLWDELPRPTPQVRISGHEPTYASAPRLLPDLGQASLTWTRAFGLPEDLRYVFYEHNAGLSFVGGWSSDLWSEGMVVSGVLIDGDGRVVGYAKRETQAVPPSEPEPPVQSATALPVPQVHSPAVWWTGLGLGIWLLRTPLAGLFSKVRPDVLENPTRRAIVEAVRGRPGINLADIAREIAAPHARIQYHLRVLKVARKVDILTSGGRTLLVPWGLDRAQKERIVTQPTRAQVTLLDALAKAPGSTTASLARSLGISQTLVARQLNSLTKLGRVVRAPGRPARWSRASEE